MWAAEIGQFRATKCPCCGDKPLTNWTCGPCTDLVGVHRELIRNLQHWRSLYEAMEVPDEMVSATGISYSLWDVTLFYEQRTVCPPRMQQSIQFCLFENMKEKVAAQRMGISASNPVSVYATIGLTTMLTKATQGDLAGYYVDLDLHKRHHAATQAIVALGTPEPEEAASA